MSWRVVSGRRVSRRTDRAASKNVPVVSAIALVIGAKEPLAVEVDHVGRRIGYSHLRLPGDLSEIANHGLTGEERGDEHQPSGAALEEL